MRKIKGVLKRIAVLSLAAMLFAGTIPTAAFAAEADRFVSADTTDTDEVTTEDDEVNAAGDDASSAEEAIAKAAGDETERSDEENSEKADQSSADGTPKDSEKNTSSDNGAESDAEASADTAQRVEDAESGSEALAEPQSFPAFKASKTLAGITVSVSAEEGVFPEGSELSVKPAGYTAIKQAREAVKEERDEDAHVAKSFTYDIKVLDKDGNEVQPADESKVKVSFTLDEVADSNLETNIYHITENTDDGTDDASGNSSEDETEAEKDGNAAELTAQKLEVETHGDTITAETDGFSLYTVEFTYNELQYVMSGGSEVALKDILSYVNIDGEVSNVKVSNESLFSAMKCEMSADGKTPEKDENGNLIEDEDGEWIVTAHKAFSTEEWMKVTINNVMYEITVTDTADITQNTAVVINSSNKSTYEGKTITGTVPADSREGTDNTFIKKAAIFVDGIELNLTIDSFHADYSSQYSCISGITLANGAELHLTVKGTNTLKGGFGGAGIAVPAGCTLEITSASTGTLNATGGNAYGGGAGIGSIGNGDDTNKALGQFYPQGLGDIIINGGTINANGGTWQQGIKNAGGAAGIGSSEFSGATTGYASSYGNSTYLNNITGSITINGGTITATGGYDAAGIGGGTCGTVQTITISGGNVTATGGTKAAAIGLGCNNYQSASGGTLTCPTVTISGGTVEANGNIGYGEVIAYSQNTGGGVTISGNADVTCSGNVTAGSTDWKVSISFAANGGSETMETVERNRGDYTLPQCTFTPPNGKAFYKWKIGENRYDPGQTISVLSKTQVIAEWIEAVTVSFEAGEGGTGTMASVPAGEGQAYVLPACRFTPNEGRIFLHWQLGDKTYRPWSSVTLTKDTTFTAVWGNQAAWTDTIVYIGGDMTYSNRIEVTGNVILDIAEGATLTVPAGIHVTGENSLTIQGKGSLIINGAVDSCAGIGGNGQESCGTVTIDGGTINVVGFKTNSNGGAGIGGGKNGGGGTITINAGVIEVTGGGNSAGIGGGPWGSGGNITINGGTINATGLGSAASIGAGHSGNGADIKITGGSITANNGIGGTNGSISLGWTNASDSITASSYEGTVSFADSKKFVLSDTGAEATTGNIGGKTIVPAVTVSVTNPTNGNVAADKSLYTIGSTATLTITPNAGCSFATLTVTGVTSSDEVTVSGTGNTRTFTMPAESVNVSAAFVLIPATAPEITTQPGDLDLSYGYTTGNVLTVAANSIDGHTLSYQWYSCDDTSRTNPHAIDGAKNASYSVPTGKTAGTTEYYYCIVTAKRTDNEQTKTTISNAAKVSVGKADYHQPAQITDITKYVPGNKTSEVTIALPALPDGAKYHFSKTDDNSLINTLPEECGENKLTFTTNSGKTAGTTAVITVTAKDAPNYNDYSFKINVIVSEYTVEYAWTKQESIWLDADNELAWSSDGVTLDTSKLTVKKNGTEVTNYTAKVGSNTLTSGTNTLALDPGAYRIAITGDDGKLDDWVEFSVVKLIEDKTVFSLDVKDPTWNLVGGSGGNAADKPPVNTATLLCNGEKLTYSTDMDMDQFLNDHPGLELWFKDNDHMPGTPYVNRIFTLNDLSDGDFYNMPWPRGDDKPFNYLGTTVATGKDDQLVFLPHGVTFKQLTDDDGKPVPASSKGGYIYYLCVDPPALHYVETEVAEGTEWALYNGSQLVPEDHYFRDSENNVYYGNGSAYTKYNAASAYGNFISFSPISYVVHGGPGVWNMDNIKVDSDSDYKFKYYMYDAWRDCSLPNDNYELVGKDFVILNGAFFYTGNIVPAVVDGNKIKIGDSFIRSVDSDSSPFHTPIVWLRNATIADLVGEERNCPHAYAKNKVNDYTYQIASCSFLILPNNSLIEVYNSKNEYKVGEDVTCSVVLHGPKTAVANVFLNGEWYTRLEGTRTHELTITGLHEGTYFIGVFLDGDDYVISYKTLSWFTVEKTDPELTLTGTTPAGEAFADNAEVQYHPENPVIVNAVNDKPVSGTNWKWTIPDTGIVERNKIVNESAQNAVNSESIYLNTLKLGEVTLSARFSGNYMYNRGTKSMTFTVVPMNVSTPIIEVVDEDKLYYDGTAKQPEVNVYYAEGKLIPATEYEVTYSNNTNASKENNKAKVTVKSKTGSLYSIDATKEFVIQETVPTIEVLPTASEITYGQTLADSTFSGGTATVGDITVTGTYTWKNADIVPAVSDSEKTEYDVVFTPDSSISSNENLLSGACKVKVKVNKAEIKTASADAADPQYYAKLMTISGLTDGAYAMTYSGEAAVVSVSKPDSGIGKVTVKYVRTKDGDGNNVTEDATTKPPVNAGTYTVLLDVAEGANYLAKTGIALGTLTINKADYPGTKTVSDIVRSDRTTENKTLTLPELPEGAVYASTGSVGGDTAALISGTPTVNGRTLTYSTTSKTDQTTATITVAVTKATNYKNYDVVVTVTARDKDEAYVKLNGGAAKTVTYDDAAFTLSKSVTDAGSGTGVWTWESSDTNVAEINAQSGAITVKKVGSAEITAQYESDTTIGRATVKLTVTPKPLGLSWSSTFFTYDGSSHQPTASLSGVKSGDDCTVSVSGAQTNAGTYTATASLGGTDKDNYTLTTGTGSFTINKASISPSVSISGWAYGSSAASPSVSGNPGGGSVSYSYSVRGEDSFSSAVPTLPGTYTVKADVSATVNYFAGTATAGFTISKAQSVLSVSPASYTKTFGDPAFALEGISSTNKEMEIVCTVVSGSDVISVSGKTVSIRGVGLAQIRISQAAGALYEAPASQTVSVSVGKKNFTPPAIAKTYPYSVGGSESINLSAFLPEDCGTVSFSSAEKSGSIVYTADPKVSAAGVLTYAFKEQASAALNGSVTVKASTANYADISFTLSISLTDKQAAVLRKGSSVTLKNSALTYGSSLSALQFNTAVFVDAITNKTLKGTLAWKNAAEIPAAGTSSAVWVFTPEDKAYASVEGSVPISVAKADPVVASLPAVASRTYDPEKALADSEIKGGSVKDVKGASLSGSWSFRQSGLVLPAGTNVVDVLFTPFDTNYNAITKQVSISVSKATPVLSVTSGAVSIQYGQKLEEASYTAKALLSGSSYEVAGSFAWEDPGKVPDAADSGKTQTLLFTPQDTENYNGTKANVAVSVTKTDAPYRPTVTSLAAKSWMQTLSEVELPATSPCWEWENKQQTLQNGSRSYTARYNGPGAGNFNNETVSITVVKDSALTISLYEKEGKSEIPRFARELGIGKSCTLYYKLTGKEKPRIIWASSNPDIATVSQSGKITAVSAGKTTVTAFSETDPNTKASCEVKVLDPVSSIKFNVTGYQMGTGETLTLTAEVLPLTADKTLIWKSSNEQVATVVSSMTADGRNRTAVVTAGSVAGSATIYAIADDGTNKQAKCSVSVGNPVPDFSLSAGTKPLTAEALGSELPAGTPYLAAGKTLSLQVLWKGQAPKNQKVLWSVTGTDGLPTDAATISDKGVLKGVKEGLVEVKAVSAANEEKSASLSVFIYNPLKSASLNTSSGTLSKAGGSLQLSVSTVSTIAEAHVTGKTPGTLPTVEYSLDPASKLVKDYSGLVSVDPSTGLVSLNTSLLDSLTASGKKVSGSAKIFADVYTFNGTGSGLKKHLACNVSIAQANPLKSISLSKTGVSINEGSSCTVSAKTVPVNPDTGSDLVWSIADADRRYLTISPTEDGSSCEIRPNASGIGKSVTISVASRALQKNKDGSLKKDKKGNTIPVAKTKCTVKITPKVTGISFSNGEALKNSGLNIGKNITLNPVLALSGKGTPVSKAIAWSSSDETIATVSTGGSVKAIKPGTATITAVLKDYDGEGTIPSCSLTFTVYARVTGLKLDKTKFTVGTAEGAQYGKVSLAQLLPVVATDTRISWSTDNANVYLAKAAGEGTDLSSLSYSSCVAKGFSKTGLITEAGDAIAVKGMVPGTVKLSGITLDGSNKTVSCSITVRGHVTCVLLNHRDGKNGVNNVTAVSESETASENSYQSTMKPGGTLSLSPVVTINNVRNTKATSKVYNQYKSRTDTGISYRSSDTSIATVTGSGKVSVNKNAKPGTVTIYAADSSGTYSAKVEITVSDSK